jgi:hypothetical protein
LDFDLGLVVLPFNRHHLALNSEDHLRRDALNELLVSAMTLSALLSNTQYPPQHGSLTSQPASRYSSSCPSAGSSRP